LKITALNRQRIWLVLFYAATALQVVVLASFAGNTNGLQTRIETIAGRRILPFRLWSVTHSPYSVVTRLMANDMRLVDLRTAFLFGSR
jgi:hypothetical protein